MSTFSSIGSALSALRYNRVAMDNASQNIANVGVEGYTRRRVEATTSGVPSVPAMWSRQQDLSGGVSVTGSSRYADAFLDARARTEHGKQSYLDVRQAVLDRIETGLGEPGDNGLAAVLGEFRQAWADLANNPSNEAARSQVLARGAAVADAVHVQARNFAVEADGQRMRLGSMVKEANTVASDLATNNTAVSAALMRGDDANDLLDQRDQLALRLSQLTGGMAVANTNGGLDFQVNGVSLVTTGRAGTLQIATGVTPTGGDDGNPVTFQIDNSATPVPLGASGEISAVTNLLDKTIPDYLRGLDDVAKTLADSVNTIHQTGYDAAGVSGGPFFSYGPVNPADPPGSLAGSLTVAVTDNSLVAASGVPLPPGAVKGAVDGSVADKLAETTDAETSYQKLVNGLGSVIASGRRLAANQSMVTAQVDGSREQLAGVNLDEEMLSMVQYQRGYEAAARVMTTVDSMLDTLINRTGLVR